MYHPVRVLEDVTDGKGLRLPGLVYRSQPGRQRCQVPAKYADEKFVLFYNSGDAYSSGIADSFKAQAAESKLEIVDEGTFKDELRHELYQPTDQGSQAGPLP